MTYALAALLVLLPVVIWWQGRLGGEVTSAAPREIGGGVALILMLFTVSVLSAVATAIYVHGPAFVDDAYITYRYAENLAGGDGLAWNRGEAPLEGFTNLLLVVLLAPLVALGAEPLLATRIMSLVAVVAVSVLIYRISVEHLDAPKATAYLVALVYPLVATAVPVAMGGLESCLFAYVLFHAFLLSLQYKRRRKPSALAWVGGLAFLALLLRPEAIFLPFAIGAAFVLLGLLRSPEGRCGVAWMAVAFSVPLGLYLLWKQTYFGSIIPNPARIKMGGGGYVKPRGLESVTGYLREHWQLVLLTLSSLTLPAALRVERLVAALLIAVYIVFYVGVDTLMDTNYRYMHPISPFLYFLALPTLIAIVGHFLRWTEAVLIKVPVAVVVLFGILFFELGPLSYARLLIDGERMDPGTEGVLQHIGLSLAEFEGVEDLTIMSQDAGLVPYLTRARHLDTAGLNDAVVARGGEPDALADYLFGEEPALVIHRGRQDGELLTYAHGPLGDQRTWASHPGWDSYEHIGSVNHGPLHSLHFFVRRAAPRTNELTTYLRSGLIERGPDELPLVLGSRRQASD